MKKFLDRIDLFLGLFERYVTCREADHELAKAEHERAIERDAQQQIFFQRQAEAAENIASSSNAQTHISKRTSEAIERSVPPRYDTE